MGVLFVGTSPPPGTIVVDNGGMQLLLLINFGGATPLNPSPNLSLFRISFEFCFPQKGYPRPQKANNVGFSPLSLSPGCSLGVDDQWQSRSRPPTVLTTKPMLEY
jgi:hypothetical protein